MRTSLRTLRTFAAFAATLFHCALLCAVANAAEPYVTNVVAKQRYPWNGKVDISFEVVGNLEANLPEGKVAELSVTMTDQKTGKTYAATNLTGDIEPTEGIRHVIWDMTAQGVQVYSPEAVFTVAYLQKEPLYRVIDISGGSEAEQYSVSFLRAVPAGGWSDEYKTDNIVLRRIDGTNGVYYAGIFEVTQAQWDKVMGGTSTGTTPKDNVSYNTIRGNANTYNWPTSTEVDPTSFIGKLRQKTGLTMLDLPSEAEWEFAARAGVTTEWLCGDSDTGLAEYAWYSEKDGSTHGVGLKNPNAWELYDVHGNVWEWCLDLYVSGKSGRVLRGGAYSNVASVCAFAYRSSTSPSYNWYSHGLRLFCRPGSN